MKVLCCPDLHAWEIGPKDEQERIREFRACMDEIFRMAQKEYVDYTIFAGDLYANNRPSPAQVQEIIKNLNRFLSYKPIVIAGNHDVCAPGQPNFVSVITESMGGGYIECSDQPTSFSRIADIIPEITEVSFAVIPYIKGLTDDQLLALLHFQVAQMSPTQFKIVVAHYATDISTYSEGQMALGNEPIFRMADLEVLPVDLVCLGHIHKSNVLNPLSETGPLILHPGALTRRNYGEEKDNPGFYIIELQVDRRPSVQYYYLPAREFVTIDPKASWEDWEKCQDAYVRFVWNCTEEEWKNTDTNIWAAKAIKNGAFYITGFHPIIEHIERSRAESLSEQTSPKEGLQMWLEAQTASPELKASAIVEFEEILKEVMS